MLSLDRESGRASEMIECFVCYLAGHNRLVHEVLSGNRLNIEPAFVNDFASMADATVALHKLLEEREKLFTETPNRLTHEQRQFLFGLVHAEPDWSLMKQPHLSAMPAIAWKLANLHQLKKSNPKKFQTQAEALERVLEATRHGETL